MTIYELAGEAYGWFETATRPDGEEFTRTKDGTPQWVEELVRDAHGEYLPDDWRYECIRSALGWIRDNEPSDVEDAHDFADAAVDVYTISRFRWLSSHIQRQFYCDEAVKDFGFDPDPEAGIASLVGLGQYVEACEVYSAVVAALQREEEDES